MFDKGFHFYIFFYTVWEMNATEIVMLKLFCASHYRHGLCIFMKKIRRLRLRLRVRLRLKASTGIAEITSKDSFSCSY